ncbi:hypothetical protein CORC01_05367 [Colletotrichum orchidophilum]|uniref:Apple domain-containing protein n=1 Tax=Colletotrichum orchidophilum TaxID=1209926 RepID=A0A1G4BDC0_9PEZI|nr:uncharacterized protein CORC01_05367 [Colletotrichum orchidophilum]OHE99326.1 hypothetical protein CORC01_05367 [Colletotrichum orchidophilum]
MSVLNICFTHHAFPRLAIISDSSNLALSATLPLFISHQSSNTSSFKSHHQYGPPPSTIKLPFTIATIATIPAIPAFAAVAEAGPLAIRDPVAVTADACQKLCEADPGRQSFVFGLARSDTIPLCYLYAVPASRVPQQSNTNLMIFHKIAPASPPPLPLRLTLVPTPATPAPTKSNTGAKTDNNNNNNNRE